MELIVMVVVMCWGVLLTIIVASSEYSNWKTISNLTARVFKLELELSNCKNHGKRKETTKEEGSQGLADTGDTEGSQREHAG